MESKDKVLEKLGLDNELEAEIKEEKKSLVKFIHVFESDSERRSIRKKIRRNKSKNNLIRERRRLDKEWKESFSYFYLNPRKFSFGLKNL
ncbi:hypothetical protein LCGC14_0880970 [marine sediment metagenome]|uniref:Uncharacterized protein n=1 Tax=marine sediment metagenome TaxID=412755 RepID=A0A0F9P6W9_9ZZZZ